MLHLSSHRIASRVGVLPVVLFAARLNAQEPPVDARELAAALAEERARIAALQLELDRRTAALTALAAQIDQLTAASAKDSAPQAPPVPTPASEPAASPARFQLYADARVRYDSLHQEETS